MAIADNMPNDRPQDLLRRIADLERAMRELRAARNLDRATITASPGLGVRTADFDGTDFAHPGTRGNYFGGDGAVLNALYLRPGSVSNNALASPVVPGVAKARGTGFALATSFAEVAGLDIVVPDGCTQLLATATASVFAYNPNTTGGSNGAGGDALYAAIVLRGVASDTYAVGVSGNGGYATSTAAESFSFTGLTPGSSIRLSVQGASAYASLAANTNNRANGSVTLLWLR